MDKNCLYPNPFRGNNMVYNWLDETDFVSYYKAKLYYFLLKNNELKLFYSQ